MDLKILYIMVYTLIVICLWIIIALVLDRKQTKQDNKDMKPYTDGEVAKMLKEVLK